MAFLTDDTGATLTDDTGASLWDDDGLMHFYDTTANNDCVGVAGVLRSAFIYSLWTFSEDPTHLHLDNSIYWEDARDSATIGGENGLVCLNIEPDSIPSNPTWQRPTNTRADLNPFWPATPTDADVILTQQIVNERLEEVSDLAAANAAQIWMYRTLQVNSMGLCFNYPDLGASGEPGWIPETIKIVNLDGGTHADLLRVANGGVLYEFYIPDEWNTSDQNSIDRLITIVDRYCDTYDALGLRHMPLIYPFTVGGAAKVEVLTALMMPVIAHMRKRYASEIATWAADHLADPTNYAPTPAAWKALLADSTVGVIPTNDTAPVVVWCSGDCDLVYSSNGVWTGAEQLYRQWYRANDAIGTGAAAIAGSTRHYHAVVGADEGKWLRSGITPVNDAGTGSETFSNWLEIPDTTPGPGPGPTTSGVMRVVGGPAFSPMMSPALSPLDTPLAFHAGRR